MANPPCMSNDGESAVFVGTMLETGDSYALCGMCLVSWSAAMLAQMTGIDPTPFIMAVSDDVADIDLPPADASAPVGGEPAGGADPPSANGKSGRTPRKSPAAGTDDGPPEADGGRVDALSPPAA